MPNSTNTTSIAGTIWWDFDGTLVARPLMWSEAGHRFLSRVVPQHQVTRARLGEALRTGFPWQRPDGGHPELATPELWWAAVYRRYAETFRRLGCPIADGDDALSDIRQDILDARRYSLFEDVVPVLDRLSLAGWRQVIVSNHIPELTEIVDTLGIGTLIHAVLSSGVVGYEKPHARMFEAAVECTAPGAPIWMVGENVDADCLPASAFGAKAILVRTVAAFERRADDLWAALGVIESQGRASI
jgi:putative hydrolase of the HAD superfamily